uniref:Uncharacterized protein n=1 Tax=Corethron hystrix TaxID=216773 RepID=A0A7S1B492_9STRA|mmetsp:Transcript_12368/g.27139  ORF Transcript_12368/g.27139 Transcript_12368/m.27139 type:complete len:140 (+) Transcript_12368:145-564(+)
MLNLRPSAARSLDDADSSAGNTIVLASALTTERTESTPLQKLSFVDNLGFQVAGFAILFGVIAIILISVKLVGSWGKSKKLDNKENCDFGPDYEVNNLSKNIGNEDTSGLERKSQKKKKIPDRILIWPDPRLVKMTKHF